MALVTFEMSIEKIDEYLQSMNGRELVSTGEVQDLLLDLRLDICAMKDSRDRITFSDSSATPVHYAPNL